MRNRLANAIIGGNGQGKSSFTAEIIEKVYLPRGERVLILTSQDPPAYKKYPRIENIEDLLFVKKGAVKYYNPYNSKQMLSQIKELCLIGIDTPKGKKYFRNGLVVFEDCTNYISANPQEELKNFLVDRRMADLDLIFTTHAIRFLPKFVRGMVNSVTIFKTAETFENSKEIQRLAYPNYHELFQAWKKVMNTPDNPKKFIKAHETITTGI